MRILYVFPHPDDESFGPAHVMHKQQRDGHHVYLLTLTRGGATKQRHRYGYSIEEMGTVRHGEMLAVEKVLNLSGMTVLDLPDSGLKEMDPRDIERVVAAEIRRVRPDVVVTYPVHGISGFHDHLVTHAVVKRVFQELKPDALYWRRLAFHTIPAEGAPETAIARLSGSSESEIDCVIEVDDVDIQKKNEALDCYVTYKETIEKSGIKNFSRPDVQFEIYQESFDPRLSDLFQNLP